MIGKTKNAGWQVGIRKTIPLTSDQLWNFITGNQGMQIIIGDTISATNSYNQDRISEKEIQYKITTIVQNSHLRMQWRLPDWKEYSILQIRVYSTGQNKAVLAIHQEKLVNGNTRAVMKKYWQEKIDNIVKAIRNK